MNDFEWTDKLGIVHKSTEITVASDVTEEILELASGVSDDWFGNTDEPVDWESFWDRLDRTEIPSTGREIDMGSEFDTPAMRKIQKYVRRIRADG